MSAGNDTITDTGGGSCIVAGGGSNTVSGVASDICISGPTLNIAAPCPLVNPSNGVTATPISSNYNNHGGQESLSLTNTAAITSMTIVIQVAQTPGITFNSQGNSYPGGYLMQSSSSSGGYLTYTFTLAAGSVIPAGYPKTARSTPNTEATEHLTPSQGIPGALRAPRRARHQPSQGRSDPVPQESPGRSVLRWPSVDGSQSVGRTEVVHGDV
jgi:hypothetical protein